MVRLDEERDKEIQQMCAEKVKGAKIEKKHGNQIEIVLPQSKVKE